MSRNVRIIRGLKKAVVWLVGIIASPIITAFITGQPLSGLVKLKGLYETFLRSQVPAWAFALVLMIAILGIFYTLTHLGYRSVAEQQNSIVTSAPKTPTMTTATNQHPPTTAVAPNRAPEPRFNFVTSDVYVVAVLEEREGYKRIEQPQWYRGFGRPLPALILEITNRPHREFRVSYAGDVVAELITQKAAPIGPLLWEGEAKGDIDFQTGHPQKLILAVGESQYSDKWFIPRFDIRVTEGGYRTVSTDHRLQQGLDQPITLTLSSHGKVIYEVLLRWKWNTGEQCPSVTVIRNST